MRNWWRNVQIDVDAIMLGVVVVLMILFVIAVIYVVYKRGGI